VSSLLLVFIMGGIVKRSDASFLSNDYFNDYLMTILLLFWIMLA